MSEFILNGTLHCGACMAGVVVGSYSPIERPAVFRCPACAVDSVLAEGETELRLPTDEEWVDIKEALADEERFDPTATERAMRERKG